MRDLKRHLRDIEGFETPNLWDEITARERQPLPSAPERRRRAVVVMLAFVVAAAGVDAAFELPASATSA